MQGEDHETSAQAQRASTRALRIAVLCGALPLVTGVGIFLAWWRSNDRFWIDAGMAMLVVGTLAFLWGAAHLVDAWVRVRRAGAPNRRGWALRMLAAAALLLVNFPVAYMLTGAAIDVHFTRTDYVISNATERAIDELTFVGHSGHEQLIGAFAAGECVKVRWNVEAWPHNHPDLRIRRGDETWIGSLLTDAVLGPIEVTLHPDDTIGVPFVPKMPLKRIHMEESEFESR